MGKTWKTHNIYGVTNGLPLCCLIDYFYMTYPEMIVENVVNVRMAMCEI